MKESAYVQVVYKNIVGDAECGINCANGVSVILEYWYSPVIQNGGHYIIRWKIMENKEATGYSASYLNVKSEHDALKIAIDKFEALFSAHAARNKLNYKIGGFLWR